MKKCIIAAVADNLGIGVKGMLPWHLSGDLQYFRKTTAGCPVIMGRTTYFSLPFRPLKGRKNIVLNLGGGPIADEGVVCVNSFDEAFAVAATAERCFIIGGASVYRAGMAFADELYITHVHTEVKDADVFFPVIDSSVWEESSRSATQTDAETGFRYEFVVYTRRKG
ncbi:MAG: dihydrofolate reductase [Bacteroidales bacterium]|nr:dihydrofolate reductase [Bacteroidales bacterium]